ncbi:hypothetical protein FDG2_0946 [Candidatus Protofrankia californiensis]|uniref:Uncharacterized protein n=1 Tax=Candidatus Protofrankia californiensis TaxID=1839754 RepID=A0A1C3NUL9_9ACTN|nr:hypothetical protein FDG2_0946 [Candidatus Protofrankia californiensis]
MKQPVMDPLAARRLGPPASRKEHDRATFGPLGAEVVYWFGVQVTDG